VGDVGGLPSGTITLLFTDIEGSTRLVREHGPAYDALLGEHRRALRDAIAAHYGAEVDSQGDAFFVAFARAHDAVAAAAAAQRALATGPVRVRMGIHTGEPLLTTGGYYVGLDLSRAARICAAAHGGQVLLSAATRDLVADEVEVRDLGEHLLKDIEAPERLFQLVVPGLETRLQPPRAPTPGNLPRPRTGFVGRWRELHEIADLLAIAPVVTLTGSGGVGKTRLALEAAHQLREHFHDGTFFVSLVSAASPAEVALALADALGVDEHPDEPLLRSVEGRLHGRQILLVLDNCESVPDVAPLVADLVDRCPQAKVLATSRDLLHVRAEHEYRLAPLVHEDAATLFSARAAAARPGLDLGAADLDVVEAICRRLDGLPLAIELAAARIRVLPLAGILDRLEERLPFLVGGAHDLPERQRTLAATIDWSYVSLTSEEQELLLALSVFTGGASLEAAERRASGGDALDLLTSLRDKSLLVAQVADDGTPRFSMLETIREYVLRQLRERGGEHAERAFHATYLVELAEQAAPELTGSRQVYWLRRLESEHDNLRAAFSWGEEAGEDAIFLRLAAALWRFWFIRGHISEGRRWLARAIVNSDGADQATLARAFFGASTLAAAAGDLEEAHVFAANRLEVCTSLGDDAELPSALSALANIAAAQGASDEAAELYERAAAAARHTGARPALANVMSNLGYLALLRGDHENALETCREAAALFEELDMQDDVAGAWLNVAAAFILCGDLGGAGNALARSLDRYVDLQHFDGVSYCLDAAATIALRGDELRRAAILAGAAAAARQRTGGLPPPLEQRLRDETLAGLEAALGDEYAVAYAEGAELELETAVENARALAIARGRS
jgi:predicted ATPase/class 3 adenylate cyclase